MGGGGRGPDGGAFGRGLMEHWGLPRFRLLSALAWSSHRCSPGLKCRGGGGVLRGEREGTGRGGKEGRGGERKRGGGELRGNPENAHALIWRAALGRGSRRRDKLWSSGKRSGSGSPRGALSSDCSLAPGAPGSRGSRGWNE